MKIAITGKIRSGKDTVADMISEQYNFEVFAFSSGIKEIIEKYFSNDIGSKRKLREHYQRIGQSMRKLDQNVWVNHTNSQIEDFLSTYGEEENVLIKDLRQKNEHKFLKDNGYKVIKVIADEDTRIARAMESNDVFHREAFNHETELSVDSIQEDYLVENNGTLEELRRAVDLIMIDVLLEDIEKSKKTGVI